jgi:hypothetical protein
MRILFYIVFACVFQTAMAAEAFNEDELAALEKIKATVEGRLRYNQVLLDILNEDDVEDNIRVENFYLASGFKGIEKLRTAQMLKEWIEPDFDLLQITHKILEECLTSQENSLECLAFLQMNLDISYKKKLADGTDHLYNVSFYELFFYEIMCNYAQAFSFLPFYKDISEMITFEQCIENHACITSFTAGTTDFSPISDKARDILHRKNNRELPQTHKITIDKCFQCIETWLHAIKMIEDKKILSYDITYYETQKQFFEIGKTIAQMNWHFRHLAPKLDEVIGFLAAEAEKELLDKEEKTPNKKQHKKQHKKQKNMREVTTSLVVPEPEAKKETSDSAEPLVSVREWKAVHLPPSDRALNSSTSTSAATTSFTAKTHDKVAASVVSRLATSSSCGPATRTSSWSDAVSSLKRPKILDFMHALNILKSDFGATIEEGAIYTISLRGPNGLTNIYCHNSHGSQDDKRWPAWRINMKDGLRAAGFEW